MLANARSIKKLHGNDWIVEMAPFMHRVTKTSFEADDTPWANVTNIKDHVFKRLRLDSLQK